jgi:outer membrane protein OmpA-like peptidoglycan-associated protein
MAKALGLAKILVFEFGESITFDVDSYKLKPAFADMLDRQAEMLTVHFKDLDVYICGYTDSLGNGDYNLTLSLARAQAVADHLASKGMPRSRIKIQGFGSAFPIASNDTSEGRAQNRRTEVILPQ